jgi:hypothetical protein
MAILAVGLTTALFWKLCRRAPEHFASNEALLEEASWGGGAEYYYKHRQTPIRLNRGPEIHDGFRGDIHPLLHGQTRLDVKAEWTQIGEGLTYHRMAPKAVYAWFTGLHPARTQQTYTEHDFSAFLPTSVSEVGQIWALDAAKIVKFLRQFHPHASMHLVAPGRRAGPEGAFGILRAVSSTHLDIAFRIHAEVYVTPDDWNPGRPMPAWYTPAYFFGQILVNKETGQVDFFQLGLPNDKALNVFLSVIIAEKGDGILAPDVVPVDRMELTGGNGKLASTIPWTTELTPAEVRSRLAKVFYKFMEIEWVPFDQVLTRARNRNRPIYAVVSWGSTDDQSC